MYSKVRQLIKQFNRDPLHDDVSYDRGANQSDDDFFSVQRAMHELKSKNKERVGKYFVHPLHMPAFEKVSIDHNIAISVRESGEYTINALGQGAAAKGHNILEKTIKRSSLNQIYKSETEVDEVLKEIEKCGLLGRVGRWSFSGLSGVYAYNKVSDTDQPYNINYNAPIEHELVDEWIKRGIITTYTGDYDIHDLIVFENSTGFIPEAESTKEKEIQEKINAQVAQLDPVRPLERQAMNVIRHGPQVNFVPYMWKYEQDKVIQDNGYLANVARPGPFPIAMVYKGEWQIFEEKEALFDFYKATNTQLPEHWTTELIDRGNGYVAMPAHSILLDKIRSKSTG